MKTRVKIILLMLFTVGAVTGVLATAKKIADPPTKFPVVDQYSKAIQADVLELDSASNFTQSRNLYAVLDDKVKRFRTEDVIGNAAADECRKKIDTSYGEHLKTYCHRILNSPNWTGSQLIALNESANALCADKLTDGTQVVSRKKFKELNDVMSLYNAALRAASNTSFVSIPDAKSKINTAKNYKKNKYIKNNSSLAAALNAVPAKIAASHYNHVNAVVSKLGRYRSVSQSHYDNVLTTQADNAIEQYEDTDIYGSNKKSIAPVKARANSLVIAATNYYENK